MTLVSSQQRILHGHDCLRRSVSPIDGTPINLVEHPTASGEGDNRTWITHEFTLTEGWGDGCAWCAMTVCVIAHIAGVLDPKDWSAGAWAIVDHLKALGLGLSEPEPGAVCAFSEGSGHVTTLLGRNSQGLWVCGDGNWGDRYQWVTRDLATSGVYGMARLPGVDVEMKALAHPATPPPPPPPGPFAGHPLVQWIGHAQVWYIQHAWIAGHGWRFTKAQVPAGQVPAMQKKVGQGVFHVNNTNSVLQKLQTVPFKG